MEAVSEIKQYGFKIAFEPLFFLLQTVSFPVAASSSNITVRRELFA
jgi:hypothetical protein